MMHYVSKFVLCFTSYGSVSNSKSDLQGHSRALTMVPFNRGNLHLAIFDLYLAVCHKWCKIGTVIVEG